MDNNYYKQYEPIFGVWHITRLIGEGSFGKVYEIQREDFGETYKAALKVISVPANQSEVREIQSEGMDDASIRTYFGSFVQDLVKEFALMSKLKGNSNVVSYENHQVIEYRDGIGWDILIQMELLTPLNEYTRKNTVTRQDVIKLGIDLCKALELCQKYNIIHRDIKPENIFISENGDFKLGDFGVARTTEKTTSGLSKKGTYTYMAPEVYKGDAYGSTVDIYSLGIVLYRLLNGNRTPFLPAAPAPITHSDRENALAKRFSGAPLPAPSHAEGRLAEIVLKACAYHPKERYSSPMQMRQELEAILYNQAERQYIYPDGDDVPQDSVHYVKTSDEPPQYEDRTQSDFGSISGGRQELSGEDKTQSDFGSTVSDFGKTVSDFGGAASGACGETNKESGPGAMAIKDLVAQMLPACATVPPGIHRTVYAMASDFTKQEWKFVNSVIQNNQIQDYGEILGFCGVENLNYGIQNINYGIYFTSTGIIFPNMTKVSKFGFSSTVYHKYCYLSCGEICAVSLCEEKKLMGIAFALLNQDIWKMVLPNEIYIHRTNVCKLIQAMCSHNGNPIRFGK